MKVQIDRTYAVGLVAVAASILVGIGIWPRLPSEVVVHFSATGTPGNTVPRTVGIAIVPVAMLVTLAVLKAAFRNDPPDDDCAPVVVTVAVFALLLSLHLLVLGWNVGYTVPFDLVFAGTLLWGAVLLAYALVVEYGSR